VYAGFKVEERRLVKRRIHILTLVTTTGLGLITALVLFFGSIEREGQMISCTKGLDVFVAGAGSGFDFTGFLVCANPTVLQISRARKNIFFMLRFKEV
jgi:hypothetical protein